MSKVFPSLVLFLVAAALGGWTWITSAPREQFVDTSGREELTEGGLLENGWLIQNWGDARIKDVYLRYRSWLGEPVSGFDATCQAFRLGRLCYAPGNPPDWKVEFDNLGYLDMQVQGYTPNPGRTPHPALRDWIQSQREAGLDTVRLVGRIVSEPVCDKKSGVCTQWTDKQRFSFEDASMSGDHVRRDPLGLWLTHPSARPVGSLPLSFGALPLALAVLVALAGFALLMRRQGYAGPSQARV
jgi:hypothetical protein